MNSGSTNQPGKQKTNEDQVPLWRQATTDVLALVINVEIDSLLRRPIGKDRTLNALAARRELADRMLRHRWLAMETARAAGASWAEIDTALGLRPGLARHQYETTLAHQKQLRLASQERHDPGPPELPEI